MMVAKFKKTILTTLLAAAMLATAAFGTAPAPCEAAYLSSGEESAVGFDLFASHHADGPCAPSGTAEAGY